MKQHLPKIIAALVILVGGYFAYGYFQDEEPQTWNGYVEGEYVWIGLPEGGILEALDVTRGETVAKGTRLYALESVAERAGFEAAQSTLAQATSERDNLLKGLRDSEIDALLSQKEQAEAELELARLTLERQQQLLADEFASQQAVDEARASYERAQGRVDELEAMLVTARLPARADEVAAANANIQAAQAALTSAEYSLSRRVGTAPEDALVFDTFYEVGEYIDKGKPVVSLLPETNIKVRFFVPETILGSLAHGDRIEINCDGCAGPILANISFISPEAEFTPPVIYSEDARAKLVFLIEAYPVPEQAMDLKPGQPVDVSLP